MSDDDDRVGERVRAARERAGLSLRACAVEPTPGRRDGATAAFLCRVESGERRPSWRALVLIAERLRVSALYLLRGPGRHKCPLCGTVVSVSRKDGGA